jgi:hypothetical protein
MQAQSHAAGSSLVLIPATRGHAPEGQNIDQLSPGHGRPSIVGMTRHRYHSGHWGRLGASRRSSSPSRLGRRATHLATTHRIRGGASPSMVEGSRLSRWTSPSRARVDWVHPRLRRGEAGVMPSSAPAPPRRPERLHAAAGHRRSLSGGERQWGVHRRIWPLFRGSRQLGRTEAPCATDRRHRTAEGPATPAP